MPPSEPSTGTPTKTPHGPRAQAYSRAMQDAARRFPEDHEARDLLRAVSPGHGAAVGHHVREPEEGGGDSERHPAARAEASRHRALHDPLVRLSRARLGRSPGRAGVFEDRPVLAARAPHALAHLHAARPLDGVDRLEPRVGGIGAATGRETASRAPSRSTRSMPSTTWSTPTCRSATRRARARSWRRRAAARRFDEANFAAGYAIAAVPARWALERRDWKGAAALRPSEATLPWDRYAYAPAITEFARVLGAARSGRPDDARAPLAKLTEIQASLAKNPVPGPYDWAAQVEAMRLAAASWLAYAEGRKDEAAGPARAPRPSSTRRPASTP